MANIRISQLPNASTLTGYELVPVVQNGLTSQTTVNQIATSYQLPQAFLTVGNYTSTLTQSRQITAGTGLTGTDAGPASTYTFSITPTGVNAGTYTNATVTVNSQGQVTSATNGTAPVTSITFGSTGLVPNTATSGAVTVSGVLVTSNGGTGLSTWTAGQIPYYASGTALSQLSIGTAGQILTVNSGATAPQWSTLSGMAVTTFSAGTTGLTPSSATSGAVTLAGTLAVTNGGTGINTLTAGYIPYGAGTSALASVSTFNYNTTTSTLNAPTMAISSVTSTTPVLSFNAANTPFASGATVASNYLQFLMQNKSGTAGASTNYVLSNDLGTDSSYYGEFGMNSSVYSSGTPSDFYSINNGVYFSGHDGDITVGSGNGFKTYFAWGSSGQSAHVINVSGAIGLNTNLAAGTGSGTTNYGTAGQVMISGGSSATPVWGNVAGGAF